MEFKTYLVEALKGNVSFITHTLGDFTDADMFTRPCPTANHAAWQLGHLVTAEASVLKNLAPTFAVALPKGFNDAYKMDKNKNDDAEQFAPFNTKAQLLEWFGKVREGTAAWIDSMTTEQLDAPAPDKYKAWAPTLGQLAVGQITHTMMHLGQFQVIRRKLGKPVLF